MSIINDALKKVQERLKKKDAPPAAPANTQPITPPPPGPTPTFTPAGPLPSNPADPIYHQSGKPVHPSTNPPPPPRTAFPKPPPKAETTASPEKKKNGNFALLIFIFIALATVALFIYREQVKPLVKNLTSSTKRPKKLGYSKTELNPVAETKTVRGSTNNSSADIKLPQDLKLNGTVVMGTKTVALINNNIYETGSQVKGFTVTEISIKKVILEKDGQQFELVVKNEF